MLNRIIHFSIKNKLIIILMTIGLVIYGGYEVTKLPIDAVPDITNNQVQIISVAPSLGATDIERLVTFPIEQANSNIPGIHEIRSFSRFGLSLVTIVFDDNIDVYWARQQVAERLQKVQTQIPPGIAVPELGPVTTGLGEIYQYVVRPKKGYEGKYTSTELRTIQDWIVRRQLLGVKGVADVSSFGGHLKQYEIAVHPDKLKALDINMDEVFTAINQNNSNTGGAYIEKGPSVLYIRSEGLTANLEDLSAIRVKTLDNGSPITIRDIADVRIGSAIRYGALTYNNIGEVSGAVVMMLKGGNSSEIIKNVKDRVEIIQKTLPEGVVIEPFLDRTKMVSNAIGTVEKNLLEGALIVVFVLVLFLGNFRAGLIVASVIPLSMLIAIILMNLFGVSGNLMSLGALDFGLIVDGAVIIVEAVLHAMHHFKGQSTEVSKEELDDIVKKTSSSMMNSAVFGQIIILVVYLPIFSLQGIEGKMFKPMAQTVTFALIGAFILSLTYIPMMSSIFISRKTQHKVNFSDRMMMAVERIYRKWFNAISKQVKVTYLIVGLMFTAAIVVLLNLGGEFIPALEEGDFALETRVLPGSNLNVSIEAAKEASTVLLKFPEVEKVVSKIGSGEVPTDPMPIDAQDLMIILKDKSEWTTAKTFDELADTMGKALEVIPGVSFGFLFPVQMRFNELMTGAKQDVVCKIFGEDLDTLTKYAAKLGEISNTVEGAADVYVEPVAGLPQIVIDYKREMIAQYGLNIEDINRIVNTAFAGQSAGQIFEGEKRFDLVVRLTDETRNDIEDVRNLPVTAKDGSSVPLYVLADVEIKNSPNQIQREDAKRRIFVGFNVKGKDMQTVVDDLRKKVDQQLKLPSGYYVTFGGAFENLKAAKARLSIAVPIALLLIFLMLFFAFKSVKLAVLIYTAIPLSTIGGIFALYFRGLPFSISAGVGFIALFGVAVLNGIVLIAEFNRRKQQTDNLREAVVEGTSTRLRPVLMTALVASLGFLPMALSQGAGAEVQRPLATVVIGGLLIATFLTLFILPLLYLSFNKQKHINMNPKIISLFLVLFVATQSNAQSVISIDAAIDSALANNIGLKNETLRITYNKMLAKSQASIPQTQLFTENGQVNSIYRDNRIGVSQTFNFPTVYSHYRTLVNQQTRISEIKLNMSALELKTGIRETYYQLSFLLAKQKVLDHNDSVFSEFYNKSVQRLESGETNVLEKNTAENQRHLILAQKQRLNMEIELLSMKLRLLMNTVLNYLPNDDLHKLNEPSIDSNSLKQHPYLSSLKSSIELSRSETSLEKSKLMPDITLSYANMTMKGVGADNVLYGYGNRFHSFQVSVGIPVFSQAARSSIKASQINESIVNNQYQLAEKEMQLKWIEAIQKYENAGVQLNYYETTGINNAQEMQAAADKQLSTGEINYLDWVLLSQQTMNVRLDYLYVLYEYNLAIVAIENLMNK
ncbi:MAG TPA: CusA/CzcA family heavy metal efflux RND transporter [Bacteroidia bacterium]